jgi:hypothetical protein
MGLGRLVPRSFIRGKFLHVPVLMLTTWVHPGEVRSTGPPARDGCPKLRSGNAGATLRLRRTPCMSIERCFWRALRAPPQQKTRSGVRSTGVEGSGLRSPRVESHQLFRSVVLGTPLVRQAPWTLYVPFWCLGGPAASGRRLCRGHRRPPSRGP